MLYMIVERFEPGAAPEIYRRARERGRQLPPGLEYLDSWVDVAFTRCFQLMRTDDPALFDAWVNAWSDLVRFEIVPVRSSSEAAAIMAVSGEPAAPVRPGDAPAIDPHRVRP